ncbi:MAG: hypothetical protein AVDCRST_MAG26-1585 [uncultured Chloroflexia bacterium]|uniref:Uncharacterized protein n=1 Tax=uncultured Chloroflexia bacterium TaxID=1672391 RepID=A0A6J4I6Q1_9CHLR|nr:MAG: hypothetical protein AVDCRST_MAG26-1585 [uncultured Chloroflexia bacterium]
MTWRSHSVFIDLPYAFLARRDASISRTLVRYNIVRRTVKLFSSMGQEGITFAREVVQDAEGLGRCSAVFQRGTGAEK